MSCLYTALAARFDLINNNRCLEKENHIKVCVRGIQLKVDVLIFKFFFLSSLLLIIDALAENSILLIITRPNVKNEIQLHFESINSQSPIETIEIVAIHKNTFDVTFL